MTERPEAPPEGQLITRALEARRPSGLTQRKAAALADISEARWRQIATGYQSINGQKALVRGPDGTVARMCQAVGVTPEELAAAGRPEAADELRRIEAEAAEAAEQAARRESAGPGPDTSQTRVEERWRMLRAVLREAGVDLRPSEQSALRDRIDLFFAEDEPWPSAEPDVREERHTGADQL
jgi:hypothetical protein